MHKKLSKILIAFFLIVFILQLASIIVLLSIPSPSSATEVKFKPQVELPGFGEYTFNKTDGTRPIGLYIKAIYKYAIGIVGILAAVVLMFGGILWLTAGGNSERISNAKSWIGASLTGLVLAMASYMILSMINPDLVVFKTKEIQNVEKKDYLIENWYYEKYSSLFTSNQIIGPFNTEQECEDARDAEVDFLTYPCYKKLTSTNLTGCCTWEQNGEPQFSDSLNQTQCINLSRSTNVSNVNFAINASCALGCCLSERNSTDTEWDDCNQTRVTACPSPPNLWEEGTTCFDQDSGFNHDFICQ